MAKRRPEHLVNPCLVDSLASADRLSMEEATLATKQLEEESSSGVEHVTGLEDKYWKYLSLKLGFCLKLTPTMFCNVVPTIADLWTVADCRSRNYKNSMFTLSLH